MAAVVVAFLAAAVVRVAGESVLGDPEERIIGYEKADGLMDPVNVLRQQIACGKAQLVFEPGQGYLRSVLEELEVPVSSQVLVFSKTSSQSNHVSPRTPRAIYFNADTYVAWVPGAPEIDLASVDPARGPIFYTLGQTNTARPQFCRRNECLQCHLGPRTLNVPGLVVQSVYTAADGTALAPVDGFISGHNSPLQLRWGGWYVTGTHAGSVHLGNIYVSGATPLNESELSAGANVTDLGGRWEHTLYLSAHSDLVALLVLEHQIRMQNLITHASYEARYAVGQPGQSSVQSTRPPKGGKLSEAVNWVRSGEAPASDGRLGPAVDWSQLRIGRAGEMLLEYMLFRDEAPLKGPVKGTSGFAEEFQQSNLRGSGHLLRQLDLQTRLVRYPCSYMIYSKAFDALPDPMKSYLWSRLQQILKEQDGNGPYATLSSEERQSLLEILRETKPEFGTWVMEHQSGLSAAFGRQTKGLRRGPTN